MVIDLHRPAIFISISGAVGFIGFIFHNSKVQTCIHLCVKFHDIWIMFSVSNVSWERTMTFLSTLITSDLSEVKKNFF